MHLAVCASLLKTGLKLFNGESHKTFLTQVESEGGSWTAEISVKSWGMVSEPDSLPPPLLCHIFSVTVTCGQGFQAQC
jgi:hypothetical protein